MKKHLLRLSIFATLPLVSLTMISCSLFNQNVPPYCAEMINEETGLFFNTRGVITKYYYHEGANYTDIIIPEYLVDTEKTSKYYGYKQRITSIGSDVFNVQLNAYAQYLNSITLPNSIETIGADAFYGTPLTQVVLPDSVVVIGDGAFQNCKNLTSITLPENIYQIGGYAFQGTSLTHIDLPDSVTDINAGTFQNCKNLESVKLSKNIKNIGLWAFRGTAITSIEIPNTVLNIGSYAFRDTKLSGSLYIPDSVVKIGDEAFEGTEITEVSIPKNCKYNEGLYSFPEGCNIIIRD